MANGACFKHIAKIHASPARKVAVLPLSLLWKHLIEYKKHRAALCNAARCFPLRGNVLFKINLYCYQSPYFYTFHIIYYFQTLQAK